MEFLRRKLPGNRNARARAVLDNVIPRADSILEVLANYHFRRAGLRVRMHVELPGVGEVDFLIEECLVVETDGGTHLEPVRSKRTGSATMPPSSADTWGSGSAMTTSSITPERMVAEVLAVLELCRRGAFGSR